MRLYGYAASEVIGPRLLVVPPDKRREAHVDHYAGERTRA